MAAEWGAAAARVLTRLALAIFLTLFVLGLILLFSPELANDLDERSGGGSPTQGDAVSTTETTRTTEQTTRTTTNATTDRRAQRRPNGAQGGNGGGRGNDDRTRQTSRRDATTETTTTETTTTETTTPATESDGWASDVFGVPAVAVLLRLAAIALLAALAALPLLWATRQARRRESEPQPAGSTQNPSSSRTNVAAGPRVPANPAGNGHSNPSASRAPAPPIEPKAPASNGNPPARPLPAKPVVTRLEAERAKARVMEGIPLLREIFAERGEPTIANTLPDMRVRVKLTDTITKEQPLPVSVLAEDPTLALGTFRTEAEQRLRRLARDAVAQSADSIDEILRSLTDEGLFEPEAADGIRKLLKMGELAVRGARVDPAMGAWVREEGVSMLLSLDLMLPS